MTRHWVVAAVLLITAGMNGVQAEENAPHLPDAAQPNGLVDAGGQIEAVELRVGQDFGGEIETRTLMEEGISFELPKSVRSLAVVS